MKYKYQDQAGEHIISEDEIIEQYMFSFEQKLKRLDKEDQATRENCIADFVITHFAWEYKEEENANNPDGHRDI